jgi:hypothetical protein
VPGRILQRRCCLASAGGIAVAISRASPSSSDGLGRVAIFEHEVGAHAQGFDTQGRRQRPCFVGHTSQHLAGKLEFARELR